MSDRKSFSRDELLAALWTTAQFLQGFPNIEFEAVTEGKHRAEIRGVPPDGTLVTPANAPGDGGSFVIAPYGKGIPQPPRKQYTLSPKVKLERVDWDGVPRAARRIAEELHANGPATSHELMARLQIARPTFNNAMSKLRKRKLIADLSVHSSSRDFVETRV